jgi:hypothetical protein
VQTSFGEETDFDNIDVNDLKERLREPFNNVKNAIKDKCTKGRKSSLKFKRKNINKFLSIPSQWQRGHLHWRRTGNIRFRRLRQRYVLILVVYYFISNFVFLPFEGLINIEEFKDEIEKAKPTGDLDVVFNKYVCVSVNITI